MDTLGLGKFGKARYDFLEHCKADYFDRLNQSGKLMSHCRKYGERASDVAFQIQEDYLTANPPPEKFLVRLQHYTLARDIGEEVAMSRVILGE